MDVKQGSVLIADDDAQSINILTEILGEDCAILTAENGESAITLAREHQPDIILLDLVMPGMGGYETLRALKNDEVAGETPVVIITCLDGDRDEEKGLEMGAADYIRKPFKSKIVNLRVMNQIKAAKKMREAERNGMTDKLTQLPNRRYFDKHLEIEWFRAMREHAPLSILMVDIDWFKPYNDTYGHNQGDVALKTVAKVLGRAAKRKPDIIARWGGEEFMVILPNTGLSGAMVVAENIRKQVEKEPIPLKDGTETFVTISVGVNSLVPDHAAGAEDFVINADKALYDAKQSGRNLVRHRQAGIINV